MHELDFEKRSIRATAEAQAQLRCPVSFHPGRDPSIPAEIIRIYEEAGGDSRKAIMSHLDRTVKIFSLKCINLPDIQYRQ